MTCFPDGVYSFKNYYHRSNLYADANEWHGG